MSMENKSSMIKGNFDKTSSPGTSSGALARNVNLSEPAPI
jgi:hypothetical protein